MAFSFGAPPAASGGTNGGNTPAPAPAAPETSIGGGFSFGSTTNTSGTSAAPSFGATATAAPSASAPATGGFSFGGSTPASSVTTAPATSSFSFGGSTPAPAPSAPTPAPATAFTFAHAPSAASALATSNVSIQTSTPVVTVPEYSAVFPNLKIIEKLDELLPKAGQESDDGRLAAQELYHVLDCSPSQDVSKVFGAHLVKPQPCEWKAKDNALREKLRTNPHVSLYGQTAAMTPPMLDQVFKLSDELHISEVEALVLYAEASRRETRMRLQNRLEYSFVDNALTGSVEPVVLGDDIFRTSRELYFYERSCAVKVILDLIQYRLALNTAVLAATDQLLLANLVENLVTFIREWTNRTEALEQELSNASKPAQNPFGLQPPPTQKDELNFAKVHLKLGYSQRQTAAESLFYLAYHTQCTPEEVGKIIDVIRDLINGSSETSGLPFLDPFHDVPNAYYDPPAVASNQFPFTQALPPLREKDSVEWQHELVDQVWKSGGKPQLLQCVSTLVLSVVCALDTRHELIDRTTHSVNDFGAGNALFPPQSKETQQLLPVHSRLDPNGTAGAGWKRKDVLGILVASYALLLRSLPSVANSPRVGSMTPSPRPPVDVKTTWRACMNAPTASKAFTCARLCLIPSFQRHTDKLSAKCDTFEFYMSVMSDFMAHFLDVLSASGDVPISRSQWEHQKEKELELRREQQEQQAQFQFWASSGNRATASDEEVIPTSVDLMARPDCLEDVFALAIALCSTGPSYASYFWSTSEEEVGDTLRKVLVPSRALRKLKHQLGADKSLLPIYVSFLAALALAPAPEAGTESGAFLVNTLLSPAPSESEASRVDWLSLMDAIRWYARELSSGVDNVSKSTTESSTSLQGLTGRASTAYYYGADDNGMEGSAGYASSQQATSDSSSSSSSKPKEMGETNTNILLSHLGIIATVASESGNARSTLVSMKLPVASQDSSTFSGDDPFLTVLFLLSIAPLTPLVRGAVFSTISSLLKVDGTTSDERKVIQEHAMKGWELLDTCRILPIPLLDQYEALSQGIAQPQGLSFPPSSTSLVSKDTKGAWLPPERIYSIVFELEQVESRTGQYPSTEGFLQLLTSLFVAAGSPAYLGKDSRPRPGCTPYIEYVADFVLPRALYVQKESVSLPFRTPSDKYRLISRALEVVEAVLVRYTVPPPPATSPVPPLVDEKKNLCLAANEASQIFGLSALVEKIVVAPNENDNADFARDYRDTVVPKFAPITQDSDTSGQKLSSVETIVTKPQFPGGEPPVPRAKSPGFTILAELLSSSGSPLLNAMVKVLTDDEIARGIRNICGHMEYKNLVTQALFGQTPPTVSSARAKSTDTSHISPQALLQPLLPQLEAFAMHEGDAVCWREISIFLALRILCAAVAREEAFYKAVSTGQTLLKIVPVLRFQRRTLPPSGIVARNVQVSRLVDLLVSFSRSVTPGGGYMEPYPAVIQYAQCDASTIEHDAEISSPAVALTYYASQSLGTNESIRALVGCRADGLPRLAKAMGKRLSMSSKLAASRENYDVASLILDSILATFRAGCSQESSIAHVILGLPFMVSEGSWIPGTYENSFQHAGSGGVTRNCLDAILESVSDLEFLTDSSSSSLASRCFEIVFRLTEATGSPVAARRLHYASNILRSSHFWTTSLMRLLADFFSGNESVLAQVTSITPKCRPAGIDNCVQCIAWLLKSVSSELFALDHSHIGSDSGQRRQLLSLLFSSPYRLLMNVLCSMPISNDRITYLDHDVMPSRETLEASRVAMPGASEVVNGYTLVDKSKLSQKSASSSLIEEQMKWADDWNASTSWDCASSHLAVSVLFLIESSMNSLDASASATMGVTGSSTSAFELHLPVDMLKVVLSRIVDEGAETNGMVTMDERLSSRVSVSLSRIVLMLSEQLASTKAATGTSNISMESSVVEICRLLVHAVISSSHVDQGRPMLPHEKLRTATFGLALSVIIKSDPDTNLLDGLTNEFLQASIVLGRLTTGSGDGIFGSSKTIDGQRARIIAQLAFSSVLDLYRQDEELSVVPLMAASSDPGVSRTILQTIVSMVAALDDQIIYVVEKLVICNEGPELLVEARLPQALRQAARDYVLHEERVKEDLRYHSMSLDVPAFLQGHMSLIKSLLLSPMLPASRRGNLAFDAMDVLLIYTDVVHRMFDSFPENAHGLIGCLQCFLLASEYGGLQQFASDERSLLWDRDVLLLSYQLSQNPFPRRYLPMLPMKLTHAGRSVPISGNVSVSDASRDNYSWWETVGQQLQLSDNELDHVLLEGPPSGRAQDYGWRGDPSSVDVSDTDKWRASNYEIALTGMEALDASLSYLESISTVRPFLSLDGCALARGLCRCSDVAKGAHFRLESLERILSERETALRADAMDVTYADPVRGREALKLERHYISTLGALMQRCSERLVVILSVHVRMLLRAYDDEYNQEQKAGIRVALREFAESTSAALDYTKIDTISFGKSGSNGEVDALHVGKSLREDLKRVPK